MDKAIDGLNVEDLENVMFNELRNFLIKNIDTTKDGKIKPTIKNLREVHKAAKIKEVLLNDDYKKQVDSFISTFDSIANLNNKFIYAEFS